MSGSTKPTSQEDLLRIIEEQAHLPSKYGLPPLGQRILGTSTASENFGVKAAAVVERSLEDAMNQLGFAELKPQLRDTNSTYVSQIWAIAQGAKRELRWSQEADIQGFVDSVLKDIAHEYDIPIITARGVTLRSLRPDILIIYHEFIPIGVIEVKSDPGTPASEEALGSPQLAGQILDYIYVLRSFEGVRGPVFAIASTYKKWRVFWDFGRESSSSTWVTRATRREQIWNLVRTGQTAKLEKVQQKDDSQYIASPEKRSLHADTKIYSCQDKSLLPTLAKVLLVMVKQSEACKVSSFDLDSTPPPAFPIATTLSYDWAEPKKLKLKPHKFPNSNTHQFLLLMDLGCGIHGHAYLAASTGGAMCVIKLFRTEAGATKEREFWMRVNKELKSRVQVVMDHPSLVMSVLPPPCPNVDQNSLEEAVRAAGENMIEAGVDHGDIKQSNIGFRFTKDQKIARAHFFDFSKASTLDKEAMDARAPQIRTDIENMLTSWKT